MNRTDFAQQQF